MGKAEAETRLRQAAEDGELPAVTAATYQARQEVIVRACEARDRAWRPLVEERRAEWLREVGVPRHEFEAPVARVAADWEPRWSPAAAVAWVLCRDPAVLRGLGSDPDGVRKVAVMRQAQRRARLSLRIERARTVDQAEAELRRLGDAGKIRAE